MVNTFVVAHGGRFPDVVSAAKAGDESAWVRIYRDLAPGLLGYLRARGAAEPEDLLGEVFLQLARDLGRFDGTERQFRAWAFAVAHHRLQDDRRSRARRPVDPAPVELLDRDDPVAPPDEQVVGRNGDSHLRVALGRLSEEQRSVVLMRLLGDLSVEQVAEALDKTPGAVKAIQHRALAKLAREIPKSSVTG